MCIRDRGRIGIVPQEADKCTDEGTDKDYQFFRAGNVHDIQVAGIFNVARYVGCLLYTSEFTFVATVRGVSFINDSKATNVNSCWYALQRDVYKRQLHG